MPTKEPRRLVYFGPELESALVAHLKDHGLKASDLIRQAVANQIGRPELAGSVQMGRPRKADEPVAALASPRKKAVASTGKVVSAPKKAAKRKRAAD